MDINFIDTSKGTMVSIVIVSSWKSTEQDFIHLKKTNKTKKQQLVFCGEKKPNLIYLMTFTDNLLSFYYGINVVCHMEQEDPQSSCYTLHIHTFLQLQKGKKNSIAIFIIERKAWAKIFIFLITF